MVLSNKLWFGVTLSQAMHSLAHLYGAPIMCQMPGEGEDMLRSAL